jgi:hypothetical protein
VDLPRRSTGHRLGTIGVVAATTLLWLAALFGPTVGAAPAGAQVPQQQVPCRVAMVTGCVTTVDGADGPVSVDVKPPDLEATPGPSAEAAVDTAAATATATTAPTSSADAPTSTADATSSTAPTSSTVPVTTGGAPPVHSGVDPWERGGLQTNFGTASIPISHYQIGADTSGSMGIPDPLDSFIASQTNWAFTTTAFLVLLATNTLDWAFEFPLAGDLVGKAGVLAQDYTIDFFGFGLSTSVYGLALSVTMIVAGFKAVTKGLIAAGSEVIPAFAAYVILIVLTLTSGFGDAGLHVARISSDLSGSIASFASGQERQEECAAALATDRNGSLAGATASTSPTPPPEPPPAAESAACSFGFALQRSLVELPYQNLQWGQVLDGVAGKERCAELNRELLLTGPWGNADEPREQMAAAPECKENADFNGQASYIRLGIAGANTLTAALVTLLVMVVAAMLLWQQIKLLFLTAVLPHTLVFAVLPGQSRAVAWRWLEHLVGVVIRTVILALGLVVWLSLFSLIVYEQLTFRGIFLSLFASVAMAVAGFYGLYKLSGLTRRVNPNRIGRAGEGGSGPGPGGSDGDGPIRRGDPPRTAVRAAGSTLRTVRTRSSSGSGGSSAGPALESVGSRRS